MRARRSAPQLRRAVKIDIRSLDDRTRIYVKVHTVKDVRGSNVADLTTGI
jgi:hypothetical protein